MQVLNRHELKEQVRHDQFTDTITGIVDYTVTHRNQVIRWTIVAGVVLIVAGIALWISASRRSAREMDLQAALSVAEAQVGTPNAPGKNFPTQDAKNKAAIKALQGVVSKDGGTREGLIAQYYLGTLQAQTGDKAAEANLQPVAKSGSDFAPLAKVALAQIYAGQNKMPEAQGYLREVINKPTDLVSKAQAQILLAKLVQPTNPAEARKLAEAVKTPGQSPAATRAADQIISSLK